MRYIIQTTSHRRIALIFFMIFLLGMLVNTSCYLFFLVLRGILQYKGATPPMLGFANRLDWALYITTYQSFALFFEYLYQNHVKIRFYHILHGLINIAISSVFLYFAFTNFHNPYANQSIVLIEQTLVKLIYCYLPFLFVQLSYKIFVHSGSQQLPRILFNQIRYLKVFAVAYLLLEMANNIGVTIDLFGAYHYSFFALSTLLSCCAMYATSKRLLGLRFLNLRQDVESKEKFNFIVQFRDILEQLSYATALKDLAHLSQAFFQAAFAIPLGRTRLYLRKMDQERESEYYDIVNVTNNVEHFIGKAENHAFTDALKKSKIFIRDEIEFTQYYERDRVSKEILQFLNAINAEIFLPIFERNAITAYIIVEQGARPDKLFTNKERDEMLVFTSYLGNVINILKYSNIEAMHQRLKEVTEELYHKHQEINQYKECNRTFMRSNKERKTGIIYYKHRKFTFANEAAKQLIGIDLNTSEGHALTRTCKAVARNVQEYKSSQTMFAKDSSGNKIIIVGIPSLEEHTTILLVSYPEISDIMKSQFDQLKDPSSWDYVLYLETTQSGQLINQLIPGTGEKLLNYKINLLATALSKKATLLDMPEEDLMATVEILHSISLRQTLKVMKLTGPEKHEEAAIKLFGLNPLMQKDSEPSLLEKLDNTGTLFIQNIEYLSVNTQDYLAEFFAYGFFFRCKSDHKIFSNVRIICSSAKDLNALVLEGKFSRTLLNELQKTSLKMPSFSTLSETEIDALAQGFAEQMTLNDATYQNLLALTEKDKARLLANRPLSLHEFREKIHQLLITKSVRNNIEDVTEFDPAYNVSDPDIARAVRLGKKALQDPQSMAILWNKFRNQNKIATLLGVNRSSVNRRCQEYNLK